MCWSFEDYYLLLDTVLSYCGIFNNLLLIYCVLWKSPKSIASYSFLLLNNAICDMLTCIVTGLYVSPRVTVVGDSVYYICNGICRYTGYQSCMFGYGLIMLFYAHVNLSQVSSFLYRWYVLHYEPPTRRAVFFVIALTAFPSLLTYFFGSLPLIFNHWSQNYQEVIAGIYPELDLSNRATFGAPHGLADTGAVIASLWTTATVLPVILIVFCIRSKILAFLSRQNLLSETTRKLHQSLLQALIFQSLLPPLYLIGSCFFLVNVILQPHNAIVEYGLYFFCNLVPIFSPIFPLYFVTPYRQFVLVLLRMDRRKLAPAVKFMSYVSSGSSGNGNTPSTLL